MIAIFDLQGNPLTPEQRGGLDACLRFARENKTDLSKADFRGKNLQHHNLRGLTLDEADFSDAQLHGAQFEDCSLINAKFKNAEAALANFSDCNLTAATLDGANFVDTTLDSATLCCATVIDLRIAKASVLDANLNHVAWGLASDFVLQLAASHHTITAINDQITIGCLSYSYKDWLRHQKAILADAAGSQIQYGKSDIHEYVHHLRHAMRCYESFLIRRGSNSPLEREFTVPLLGHTTG